MSQARGRTSERGYTAEWRKLSELARRLQPWCSVPGCTSTDLTVDHVNPATRGHRGLTLTDIQVLCRSHNGSKGNRTAPIPIERPRPRFSRSVLT